jgi:hypothetical protein
LFSFLFHPWIILKMRCSVSECPGFSRLFLSPISSLTPLCQRTHPVWS